MKNLRGIMIPAEFSNLPFAKQLILWGVRLWVRALKNETNAHDILHNGFKLAGVPNAHLALNGLMTVVASTATGNIDIRCSKCTEISEDEHFFLGAIAARQIDARCQLSGRYIAHWFTGESLTFTYEPMALLANELKQAGLYIRQRVITAPTANLAHAPADNEKIPATLH